MIDNKIRKTIPVDVMRSVMIESGLKCAVPQCSGQWPTLQFHHIDENPSNNIASNLLLLCPTHHQMVTSRHLDRKTCRKLKDLVSEISNLDSTIVGTKQSQLLFSLMTELFSNLILFADPSFHDLGTYRVYPKFRHVVLDQVLVSSAFIFDMDGDLFSLIYDWAISLDDINRRLDISEIRDFKGVSAEDAFRIRSQILNSPAFHGSRKLCKRALVHLLENYGDQVGIGPDTVLFARTVNEVLSSVPE